MEIEGGLVPREIHPFAESLPTYIEYVGEQKNCRYCDMPILWCRTKNAKRVPMDMTAKPKSGIMVAHHVVCPEQKRRKPKKEKTDGVQPDSVGQGHDVPR